MNIVYLNGRFFPEASASIPVTDQGFLFGDGVFTTIRVTNGRPEFLNEHLKRILHHCQELHIIPPAISSDTITDLIKMNKDALQGVWRLKIIITGKESERHPRTHHTLLMTLKPYEAFSNPLKLCVIPKTIETPFSRIKTLSYLDRLWVKSTARKCGYEDGVTVNSEGFLLESAFSNLFWVEGKKLFTPCSTLPLLEGVTLNKILHFANQLGMEVHHVKSKATHLHENMGLYLCNAMRRFTPVECLNHLKFKRDTAFEKKLLEAYEKAIN